MTSYLLSAERDVANAQAIRPIGKAAHAHGPSALIGLSGLSTESTPSASLLSRQVNTALQSPTMPKLHVRRKGILAADAAASPKQRFIVDTKKEVLKKKDTPKDDEQERRLEENQMKLEIRVASDTQQRLQQQQQPDFGSHNVNHNVNLHPLGGTSPRLPGGVLPTLGDFQRKFSKTMVQPKFSSPLSSNHVLWSPRGSKDHNGSTITGFFNPGVQPKRRLHIMNSTREEEQLFRSKIESLLKHRRSRPFSGYMEDIPGAISRRIDAYMILEKRRGNLLRLYEEDRIEQDRIRARRGNYLHRFLKIKQQ